MQSPSSDRPVILVTGASGQLGMALQKRAPLVVDMDFRFVGKNELDVTVESGVRRACKLIRPAAIVNCAAYTNVERAEMEEELAYQVNSRAPGYLAEACKEVGALLVHYSTDYVFDGESTTPYLESDVPNPLSAYGRTKLEGERLIDEAHRRHVIIRTSWLYGPTGHNFYRTMIRLAGEHPQLNVVSDQVASPTYVGCLADDTIKLLRKIVVETRPFEYGLYHYSQDGVASWYDFACAILTGHNLKIPVVPQRTSDFPTKATRPAYSKLNNQRWKEASGLSSLTWEEALRVCIEEDLKQYRK